MLRVGLVALLCAGLVLAGCNQMQLSPEETKNIRSVGVISALGDELTVHDLGYLWSDRSKASIEDWHIDDFVLHDVAAMLRGRYDVVPVEYDRHSFLGAEAIPPSGRTLDEVSSAHAQRPVDAFIVIQKNLIVWPEFKEQAKGISIFHASPIGSESLELSVLYSIAVVDGRSLRVRASTAGVVPRDCPPDLHFSLIPRYGRPIAEMPVSWWTGSPQMTMVHAAELRAGVMRLIDDSLTCTLRILGLRE